jgi:hypothetical protein
VFEVYAVDAYGNADPTPVVRHFKVAAPPQPGGTPGGGGAPGGGSSGGGSAGGGSSGNAAPTAPVAPATPPRKRAIRVTLRYAYSSPTRLTRLSLRHVPRGSTLRVTCKGRGCPKALKHAYVKRHARGTVSLARFIKHRFRAGIRLTFRISHPHWRTTVKTLRFRAGRAPLVN